MVEDRSLAGHLRFLLKDTAVYGLAGAVAKLLAIFTVPILTRLFSTSEYGLIDAITIVGTVFIPAVILGQDSSIGRFYYDTDDRRERREIVSTGLSVQMAFSALVAAAQFILAAPILDAYLRSTAEVDCMRLMALALPATVLVRNTQNLLKWTFRRRRYLVLTLGITVVNVAATLFLVLVARLGVTGVFYANLFAQAAFAGTGMWFCRDLIAARFNWRPWLKPMVLFGLPYTLVGIADAVFPSVDRFFIARYLTLDSLGIYSVGMKVASLLMLVVTGFQTAWGPFAYATYRQPGANQTFARILLLFTYVGCLGVVGLVALGKPLILLMASEKYADSYPLVGPLAFSAILGGIYYIVCIGMGLSKKTIYNAVAYMSGVAVFAGLANILVPILGLQGAALGLLSGKAISIMVVTVVAGKLYPIPYDFRRFLAILALAGLSVLFLTTQVDDIGIMDWFLRAAVLLGYGMASLCLVMQQSERTAVYKQLQRMRRRHPAAAA